MAQPVDLAFAFGLEPRAAVEYFRAKGYAITFNWEAMAAAAHARAFTVAKVMRMDVLESIRGELDRALSRGLTLESFKANLEPRLKALGWWGKQVVERPDGTGQVVNVSSPHRLETIYRTNLQSSFMAGRWHRFMENVANRPFGQYLTIDDDKVRPAHAVLHGRVFRLDDPIWKTCWPPNGYRCRCRVRALSQRDLERKGLAVSQSGEDLTTFEDVDPGSGQVFERVAYKGPGMQIPFAPDRGFVGNQALAASTPEVAAGLKSKVLGAGADRALAEISRANWGEWSRWIDEAFDARVARGGSRVLGYAQALERGFIEGRGLSFSTGALEVEDRLVVGRKAARYEDGAVALGREEWKTLPLVFAAQQAILFDVKNQTLLYVMRSAAADSVIRVVVKPAILGRRKGSHDSVRSVQRVKLEDLAGALRGGLYELVSGRLLE